VGAEGRLHTGTAGDARERIREAMIDLVLEDGFEATTLDRVAERAEVEHAELVRRFSGAGDLYIQIYQEIADAFDAEVIEAFTAHESWRDGLRACAYAAARHIRDHPREARFGTVQMFATGDLSQARRDLQLHRMVDLIDAGREELDDPDAMDRGVAEGVIGSIFGVLVRELQSGRGVAAAESHVPELMYIAVRPYLGHAVAHEELSIPAPPEKGALDA
jgi:AcrR family transcriptional regulator